MESLLAHIERRERGRLSVSKVDIDERPEVAERFRVDEVPALALVVGKRVVSRLDGRATAPRIEAMLAEHSRRRSRLASQPGDDREAEVGRALAVDDAVVERHGDIPHRPRNDLAVTDDGALVDAVDAEDRDLGMVDRAA